MTPAIERATRDGATFSELASPDEHGNKFIAESYYPGRRPRAVMVQFMAPTKDAAARAYCNYFHLRFGEALPGEANRT